MADGVRNPNIQPLKVNGVLAFSLLPLVLFLIFSPLYDSVGILVQRSDFMLMDMQRVTEILAIGATLLALCISICWTCQIPLQVPFLFLLGWFAFFSIGVASSGLSMYPRFAWVEWSWLLCCLLATTLVSAYARQNMVAANATVRLFVLSAVASYAPLYYMRNSDALFDIAPIIQPFFFGFNNVRVFSDYQTAIVCLLPWALGNASGSRYLRAVAWGVAGCYTALAFESGSRSLFLGQTVAALFVWLLVNRKESTAYLVGQIRLWSIAACIYTLLFMLLPILAHEGREGHYLIPAFRMGGSGRLELWVNAIAMTATHPWLGVGPMHFASVPNGIAASPHNQVLQLMAEFGVVAALLFVLLTSVWLAGVLRGIRSGVGGVTADDGQFSTSVLAAFFALIAQSFVSPVFNNPHSQGLLVLLGGVLGGYVRWWTTIRIVLLPKMVCFITVAVAVGVFLISCLPWALQIKDRNSCYFALPDRPTKLLAPRFWQQGWLDPRCETVL